MLDVFRTLFAIELRLFLRNKAAVFWMAAFPVLLFAILHGAFGGTQTLGSITIDVRDLDHSRKSEVYLDLLHGGFTAAKMPVADFHNEGVDRPVASDSLKLVIPPGWGDALTTSAPTSIALTVGGDETVAQRAAIGIILGLNTEFNARLAGQPQRSKVTVSTSAKAGRDVDYDSYLAVGVVVMTIISTCLMGLTTPIVAMRERGTLKMYSIMPMSKSVFMAAVLVTRLLLVIVFTTLFFVIAKILFGVDLHLSVGSVLSSLAVVILATWIFLALGLAIAGRVESIAAANAVTNAIYFPIVFLSNLVIPFDAFPSWLHDVLAWLPSTLTAAALRANLGGSGEAVSPLTTIAVLLAFAVAASVLSAKSFRWDLR